MRTLGLSLLLTGASLFAFQNCAQPNQISNTAGASANGGLTVSYTPANVTAATMVTINVSGGAAPYQYALVQGHGSLSGNVYLTPNGSDSAEIKVTDANFNQQTVTFNVKLQSGTQAFAASGSFVVPANVTSIAVKGWGAGGGGGGSDGMVVGGSGGGGSFATGNVAVTPGETLAVTVGGGGTIGLANATGAGGGKAAGGGGGAGGAAGTLDNSGGGGGGGGGTFLYRGTTLLFAAGGGGGGGGAGAGSAAASGDGGPGDVNGSSVTSGGTGGIKGSMATETGANGFNRGAAEGGGGGGGGGGGYKGGGAGMVTSTGTLQNRTGGGGGGGSSLAASIQLGAGTQAGNAGDPDRFGAGTGGAAAATTSAAGATGRIVISW